MSSAKLPATNHRPRESQPLKTSDTNGLLRGWGWHPTVRAAIACKEVTEFQEREPGTTR
jgi:hypothetical protein